jgi:hypothetical protein
MSSKLQQKVNNNLIQVGSFGRFFRGCFGVITGDMATVVYWIAAKSKKEG